MECQLCFSALSAVKYNNIGHKGGGAWYEWSTANISSEPMFSPSRETGGGGGANNEGNNEEKNRGYVVLTKISTDPFHRRLSTVEPELHFKWRASENLV